jgi:hypothetical protein
MKKKLLIYALLSLGFASNAQFLDTWHNIHWQEAITHSNMQLTFSEMNRQLVMQEIESNKANKPTSSPTIFTKGKSTIVEKLAAQSNGKKQDNEALLMACLEKYYDLLKNYRLADNDLAQGMAFCATLNYNTYHNKSLIDVNGLKMTTSLLQKTLANNKILTNQTSLQKQEAMEQMAIGSIMAQMAVSVNHEKAKSIASGIFYNILNVSITNIELGSNGFYTLNEKNGVINSIKTTFNRSNSCYACNEFSNSYTRTNNNQNLPLNHFKNLLTQFNEQLIQKGKKTNDIADMLTECFMICYKIKNNPFNFNDLQIQSIRNIFTENLSYEYNEFKAKSDQQIQLLYEDYVLRTMHAQYLYQKGKKEQADFNKKVSDNNPNNVSDNVFEAMSRAYTPTPEDAGSGEAYVLMLKMLKPLNLYDFILTEEGFIRK